MDMSFIIQAITHPDVTKEKKVTLLQEAVKIRNEQITQLNEWLEIYKK